MQQARQLSSGNRLISPAQPIRTPGAKTQTGSRLKKVKLLIIIISCFMFSIVVVAQYSSLVMINYRLGNARSELAEIKEASRILELEVAKLSTIGRIEKIARADLGMVEPEISQLRILTARQGDGNRLGE
jgi:cell division protein FtsL